MGQNRILLVEDSEDWQKLLVKIFERWGFVVTLAKSIEEAETCFMDKMEFDIVIMDGCLNSNDVLNSLPLIQKIRNEFGYSGLMIASSGSLGYVRLMVKAGCDEGVLKSSLTDRIRELKTGVDE